MKKTILLYYWVLFLLMGVAGASAQNTKIIFPTPADFEGSTANTVRPTADGGFILTGRALDDVANDLAIQPRIVKLNAALETEWDRLYLGAPQSPRAYLRDIDAALQLPDGQYFIGMEDDSSNIDLIRLDAQGNLLEAHNYPESTVDIKTFSLLPDGNVLAVRNYYSSGWKMGIVHLDASGDIVFSQVVPGVSSGASVVQLTNGDLLFRHYQSSTQKYILTRTTSSGVQVWQSAPTPALNGLMVSRPNNGFAISTNTSNPLPFALRMRQYDAAGVIIDTSGVLPCLNLPATAASYPDGSYLLTGSSVTNRGYMLRTQPDGTVVWAVESTDDNQAVQHNLVGFPTTDGWAAGASEGAYPNGNLYGFLRAQDNTGLQVYTLVARVAKDNDESCSLEPTEPGIAHTQIRVTNTDGETWTGFADAQGLCTIYLPAGDFTATTQTQYPFFFLCPTAANTVSFPGNPDLRDTVLLPQQTLELIHQISGTLTLDQNDNCQADAGETPLSNWNVRVGLGVGIQALHLDTDAGGHYSVFVPDGDYSVTILPFNQNYGICGSAANVSFNSPTPQAVVADFVAFPEINCAQLLTDIGIPPIRPCVNAQIKVQYRNNGTVESGPVTVKVSLDPAFTYLSALPVPSMIDGQTLWFDLASLPPMPSNTFSFDHIRINVQNSCALVAGNEVCVAAEITGTNNCPPVPGWNGAITAVEGECVGDSTVFTIRNIGNAPHSQVLDFVIVEDQIVLKQGTFQLPPGGFQIESVLAPGMDTAVVIIADQEPGYPGPTTVTYSVSNCSGSGSHPTAFGGTPGPNSAQRCRTVTTSYDPNDKQAYPEGQGPNHIVQLGTSLQYTIRFQNTGTDTAFLVVIRDTLAAELDPETVGLVSASHPFEMFRFGNLLGFTFANILLPDSTTNAPASQGYVHFTISPRADLESGTVVDNRAAIYFDFNEPVITNTVTRTYEDLLILVETETPGQAAEQLAVQVFPNPFRDHAILELPADAPAGDYRLDVYDAAGRLLQTLPLNDRRATLDAATLPNGVLGWQLRRDGQSVSAGRIVRTRQ